MATYKRLERGIKRKFEFDEEKLESAAREAEESALEKIQKEQVRRSNLHPDQPLCQSIRQIPEGPSFQTSGSPR